MDSPDTLILTPPPRRRVRPLFLLTVGMVAALVGAGAGLVTFAEFEESTLEHELPVPVAPIGLEPIPLQWQPSDAEPEAPQPIPLDNAEQTGTGGSEPCPGLIADGLVVTPNPVRIVHGSKGYFDIQNCGDSTVDWSAETVAWVDLADSQGSLASGAVFRVLFTVDTSDLPTGPYNFVISVNDVDVPVSGTKLGGLVAPGVTPSPVPTVGGLIAPGLPPCATKCITRAWLTPHPGRADMALEVATNTSARISVQVDTDPPAYSNDGKPYYTDPHLHLTTQDYRRQWTTVLSPLQPDTTYHIVVAALDTLGGTSFQTGTFHTPEVADQFAAAEPGGCSIECVQHAQLRPIFGTPEMLVEVRTLVPTRMQVLANGQAIAGTDGAYQTEWEATLPLAPGTRYEVVLRVTDEQGRSRQHTALVDTPAPATSHLDRVLVTFHQIVVHDDGDNGVFNPRGELRFLFQIDGVHMSQLDTDEHKVKAPATLSLDDGDRDSGRGVLLENAPEQLLIRVQGRERDWEPGMCTVGTGPSPDASGNMDAGGCDIEWNTAEATVDLHAPVNDDALPRCFGFPAGVTGDMCLVLAATGEDPRFDVFITIDFIS